MQYLVILVFLILIAGCQESNTSQEYDSTSETKENEIALSVYDDGVEIIVVDKNGRKLEFENCYIIETETGKKCQVSEDAGKLKRVNNITLMWNEIPDNTTCCLTMIIDGKKKQLCKEFDLNQCPSDWVTKN